MSVTMGTPVTTVCPSCGDPFTYPSATRPRIYCSRRCRKLGATWRRAPGYENHRARARAAGVEYQPIDKRAIYERDAWTCGICSQPVDAAIAWPDPTSASLDHVVPLAKGGPHVPSNVQLAHLRCNTLKGRGTPNL